jgi:hypothetical protein
MSALGQKRTFRPFIAMSALPPKADIDGNHQQEQAVLAFVGFSDDCRLFVFLVVMFFVAFILVIIVVWVLRRQAHNGDKASVE